MASDGTIDKRLVPDFVPVLGHDGRIVGYSPKHLVIPDTGAASTTVPVYAADLATLIGHMVADRGFVPLGEELDSAPAPVVATPTP